MIDIVDFWKQQIERYNLENKCGFCWVFSGTLEENASNKYQTRNSNQAEIDNPEVPECCVHTFITNIRFRDEKIYNSVTSFMTTKACNVSFDLFVGIKGNLGINNYDEIPNHLIEQSLWVSVLKPLQECMSCENVLEFCDIINMPVQITQWNGETKINYLDDNYTGWKIQANFRIPK